MSFKSQMAKKAAPQLAPGEVFVTALRVEPNRGLKNSLVGTAAGFAVGGLIGADLIGRVAMGDAPAAPGWPQVGPMAIAVTNRRLLGWSISMATARPNVFVGGIDLAYLASVEYKHGLMPHLTITMRDGTLVEFDIRYARFAKRAVPLLQQLLASR
jgi:hypothetical protein